MREILFRGKAINRDTNREYRTNYKNGDWVYGLASKLLRYKDFPPIAEMTNEDGVSGIDIDIDTIGQFTGKCDKNGKKIFEGDIVEYTDRGIFKVEECGVVKYKDAGFCIEVFTNDDFCDIPLLEDGENTTTIIIGNIHDNPELLEVQNE